IRTVEKLAFDFSWTTELLCFLGIAMAVNRSVRSLHVLGNYKHCDISYEGMESLFLNGLDHNTQIQELRVQMDISDLDFYFIGMDRMMGKLKSKNGRTRMKPRRGPLPVAVIEFVPRIDNPGEDDYPNDCVAELLVSWLLEQPQVGTQFLEFGGKRYGRKFRFPKDLGKVIRSREHLEGMRLVGFDLQGDNHKKCFADVANAIEKSKTFKSFGLEDGYHLHTLGEINKATFFRIKQHARQNLIRLPVSLQHKKELVSVLPMILSKLLFCGSAHSGNMYLTVGKYDSYPVDLEEVFMFFKNNPDLFVGCRR
ncbi:MAG: hypothetical protein AAFO91_20360, partial [Bacteroidota bacterium]